MKSCGFDWQENMTYQAFSYESLLYYILGMCLDLFCVCLEVYKWSGRGCEYWSTEIYIFKKIKREIQPQKSKNCQIIYPMYTHNYAYLICQKLPYMCSIMYTLHNELTIYSRVHDIHWWSVYLHCSVQLNNDRSCA